MITKLRDSALSVAGVVIMAILIIDDMIYDHIEAAKARKVHVVHRCVCGGVVDVQGGTVRGVVPCTGDVHYWRSTLAGDTAP